MGLPKHFALSEVPTPVIAELFTKSRAVVPEGIPKYMGTDAAVHPMLLVLPMGFPHAFDFAHACHEQILSVANPVAQLLSDRRPVPDIKPDVPTVMVHADNAGYLPTTLEPVTPPARNYRRP